jgi:hypothetical protein
VAELQANGYDAVDAPGEKSQFDVVVDGRLLFSKQREGRYPDHDEITALLG